MKICFLSHITNYHTKKWCKYFCDQGYDVHVISFEEGNIDGVTTHFIDLGVNRTGGDLQKLKYMTSGKKIKNIVNEIEPDIINVHFATSYGIAAALSGINDYYLSVWGYDVYDFPKKSLLHKMLLKYSLKKANYILSTSNHMAKETNKYTNKEIKITPFGVDTEKFRPVKIEHDSKKITIGVIKALTEKYGIQYLIRALAILTKQGINNIELRIAGDGDQKENLKNLAKELGVEDKIVWLGFISESEVISELNKVDIVVIPSILDSESFGVSAIEAEACEVPVIVTNVGGLTESTSPGVTSIVVQPKNYNDIADAIKELMDDPCKRKEMGKAGRMYVKENFELKDNFKSVENIFLNRKNL